MHIYLKRDGIIGYDLTNEEGWEKVIVHPEYSPIVNILSSNIVLITYEEIDKGILVVFPYRLTKKTRIFTLTNVPKSKGNGPLIHSIFAILLDFDDGRLTNRKRNDTIRMVRELLPDVVRGNVGSKENLLTFYLFKNKLSIYKQKVFVLRLDDYTSFSNNIKDSF